MRFEFLNQRQLGSSFVRRVAWLAWVWAGACHAADAVEPESWNLKFQSTYVWQQKNPMSAGYSGANANSLSTGKEHSYSSTVAVNE